MNSLHFNLPHGTGFVGSLRGVSARRFLRDRHPRRPRAKNIKPVSSHPAAGFSPGSENGSPYFSRSIHANVAPIRKRIPSTRDVMRKNGFIPTEEVPRFPVASYKPHERAFLIRSPHETVFDQKPATRS